MLTPLEKRELSNKLLNYLSENYGVNDTGWKSNHDMIFKASDDLGKETYELWKAFDLLKDLGRIEYNCRNGRKGAHLTSNKPLEYPVYLAKKCEARNCPIVKAMMKTFPELKPK